MGLGNDMILDITREFPNQICTSNLHDRLSIWLSRVYLDDAPIPKIHVFCSKIHWFIDDFSQL